jgi:hypothetical protein
MPHRQQRDSIIVEHDGTIFLKQFIFKKQL